MYIINIDIEYRVLIGISAMVILFTSFLIAFVISQRKKLQYHKDLHVLHDEQKKNLTEQNELLEKHVQQRTTELSKQKEELQNTLAHLKTAQAKLIQSEKMASLGELTAGIAHEIQNPLNFVNNFSELSVELLKELKDGPLQSLSDTQKLEAGKIIEDLSLNLEKINDHGMRAGSIVKGMLLHSRSNSGKKELVDVNVLANEYFQLSYFGIRANDKSFIATLRTDFDQSIGTIEVIPQEIGQVMVNLCNNAFYSVKQKKKQLKDIYEPIVSVITKKSNDKIEIIVNDNGNGIPSRILHKIFQPFFTTKPSGQGTGLGLSLSYDIITKGHGGHIDVESKEGEYAKFTILLPQ